MFSTVMAVFVTFGNCWSRVFMGLISILYSILSVLWMPSVLWRCWLGGRKGIQPVKKLSGGVLTSVTWLSVWSEVQTFIWPSWCHRHSLSLASVKSRLVWPLAHPGSPGQRAVKRCVCYFYSVILSFCWCAFVLSSLHCPLVWHPQEWEDCCALHRPWC